MEKIHGAGIGGVCVESRPHPDFLGEQWWHDLDIVFDEAKKRNMKVWILDDRKFPTGYANGVIEKEHPEKQRKFLRHRSIEVVGPMASAAIDITHSFDTKAEFYNACLYNHKTKEFTQLPKPQGDMIYFDIPAGRFTVYIIYTSVNGGNQGQKWYLNLMVHDHVKMLLDTVYEPHYERYKEYFGNVFMGFFSDEPCFGNINDYYNARLGRDDMVLPWCEEMEELIDTLTMPSLWCDVGNELSQTRFHYMDVITKLYEKNFNIQMGEWCRAHNVQYIGHVVEDNNAHARLGGAAGHFFRAMTGQDMSGIDVVLLQLLPGLTDEYCHMLNYAEDIDYLFVCKWEEEFFHYALAKLGSSYAHLDPKKAGRAMCEIFGGFGWTEGLKLMKWLADHMIVNGINHFVPHAFSPKEFPDPDNPPHFYNSGYDPQFKYWSYLMNYMNRLSDLLSGGKHVAQAAIMYHGESEWSGKCMMMQKPARVLAENQIEFDFLCSDFLEQREYYGIEIGNGYFNVNGEKYETLILSWAEYITEPTVHFVRELLDAGVKVYVIDALPTGICGRSTEDSTEDLKKLDGCMVIGLDELAAELKNNGIFEISCSEYQKDIRYYHAHKENVDYYMLFNEAIYDKVCTTVTFPVPESGYKPYRYDAYANKLYPCLYEETENGVQVEIALNPYESTVIVFDEPKQEMLAELPAVCSRTAEIEGEWTLTLTDYKGNTVCENRSLPSLVNVNGPDMYPRFSGTMVYNKMISVEPGTCQLDLGMAYETAEVLVNGKPAGVRIAPPYLFDIEELVTEGENEFEIRVTNTVGHDLRDRISSTVVYEPSGLMGPVKLKIK